MNTGEVPSLVTEVLGTEQFADEERQALYQEEGYAALGDDPERQLIHIGALRAVARLRAEARSAWRTAHPDESFNDQWQLSDNDMSQLRTDLRPMAGRLRLLNGVEVYTADESRTSTNEDFVEHQQNIFAKAGDFLRRGRRTEAGGKRGLIELPRGADSEETIVRLVEAAHESEEPLKSIVVVQGQDDVRRLAGHQGDTGFGNLTNLHVTSYFEEKKDLRGDVVVMTYQSFKAIAGTRRLPQNSCDLVVFDKAHLLLGPEVRDVAERFTSDKTSIAVAATREYGVNRSLDTMFPNEIYKLSKREAVHDGVLAPVQCLVYKTSFKADFDGAITSDFTPRELENLAAQESRNQNAADFAKAFVKQGMKGVISCIPGEHVLHPHLMVDMLAQDEEFPIAAKAITGDLTPDQRQKIYDEFQAGDIQVITFVGVMPETGFDFCINARPTTSTLLNGERLDALLAPNPGDKIRIVVDLLDETKKAQQTALHALGEYRYRPDVVYGRKSFHGEGEGRPIHLPTDLLAGVYQISGQEVRRLTLMPNYEHTHSVRVTIESVAENLQQPLDVIENMARFLGVAIIEREAPDGSTRYLIDDEDATLIETQLNLTRFDRVRNEPDRARRDAFFAGMEASAAAARQALVASFEEGAPTAEAQIDFRTELSLRDMSELLLGETKMNAELVEALLGYLFDNNGDAVTLLKLSRPEELPRRAELPDGTIRFEVPVRRDNLVHIGIGESRSAHTAHKLAALAAIAAANDIDLGVLKEERPDYSEVAELEALVFPMGRNQPMQRVTRYAQTQGLRVRVNTGLAERLGPTHVFSTSLTLLNSDGEVVAETTARGLKDSHAEAHAATVLIDELDIPEVKPGRHAKKERQHDEGSDGRYFYGKNNRRYTIPNDPVDLANQWERAGGTPVIEREELVDGLYRFTYTLPVSEGPPIVCVGDRKQRKVAAKRSAAIMLAKELDGRTIF